MSNQNHTILIGQGIHKTYFNGSECMPILKDINIKVKCGEIVLLMGPNGSGKTTLLSIVGTLLEPTEGEIYFMNTRISSLSENELCKFRLHNIGFIFQSFRLLNSLTVIENILFVLKLNGITNPEARSRAEEMLKNVKIIDKARFFPNILSGGEKQLVAIARACANDPPLIIADEPTASLDFSARKNIMEYLSWASKEKGKTIIVASNDERLKIYADRVLVIEDGKLINT